MRPSGRAARTRRRHDDLDILKPLRWSTDGADSGNVSGVYADKDWIRPIYFGVVNRKRCFGLINGFFDQTADGEITLAEDAGYDRRFYRLTVGVTGLPRSPWQNAMIYILPPDTFEFWNEWTRGYQWQTSYSQSFVHFPPLFGHQRTTRRLDGAAAGKRCRTHR